MTVIPQKIMSTERQAIHAVYDDPQVDGMEDLYEAKMSLQQNFEQAYAEVIASGDTAAQTWIHFCTAAGALEPKEEDFRRIGTALPATHGLIIRPALHPSNTPQRWENKRHARGQRSPLNILDEQLVAVAPSHIQHDA